MQSAFWEQPSFQTKDPVTRIEKSQPEKWSTVKDLSEHIYMGVCIENSILKLMFVCIKSECQKDNT